MHILPLHASGRDRPRPWLQHRPASNQRYHRSGSRWRDHLFRRAGHTAPTRTVRSDHVSPGLMRILDRLENTPAQVISDIAETLVQNRPAIALLGEQTRFQGDARSAVYRWFTDPAERRLYPQLDQAHQAGILVANPRVIGHGLRAAQPRRSRGHH